jgi:hypothetical protein
MTELDVAGARQHLLPDVIFADGSHHKKTRTDILASIEQGRRSIGEGKLDYVVNLKPDSGSSSSI